MKMIYLITGLMASGKSTVAELLAKKFNKSVHLRGDNFRKFIVHGRVDMSAEPTEEALAQLDLRYRLTAQTAKAYHAEGFAVVVQDNYYGDRLPYILGLLEPDETRVIVLCPDVNTIWEREKARGKTGYGAFDIDALYREFMDTTPRLGTWIDNSAETPEQTVRRILERLSEK